MPTPPNVGDPTLASFGDLVARVPITIKLGGIASTGTANVVLATQVINNPYGAGVPYRVRVTYLLGFVTGAAGVNARMYITVNGTGQAFSVVSPLAGALVYWEQDMAAGGSVTMGGSLTNISGTMTTFLDSTNNLLTCEVEPL